MKKKYQIFISSTFLDLQEERLELLKAVLNLGWIPAGMELFPASNESQWDYIKSVIDECDYYVLIVAGRYGSLDEDNISYTEKEYWYAQEKGIPTIAFLHSAPDELPMMFRENDEKKKKKLQIFRKTLSKKLVKYWRKKEELESQVVTGLHHLEQRFPAYGWIRYNPSYKLENGQDLIESVNSKQFKIEINEDKPPHLKNQIEIEELQFYLWNDYEFDSLWIKIVFNATFPKESPSFMLSFSPKSVELRDASHFFFMYDSFMRPYQKPNLISFKNDNTIGHVFYTAEKSTRSDNLKKAIPYEVKLEPARIRIDGSNNGVFQMSLLDFSNYRQISELGLNRNIGIWTNCRIPSLIEGTKGKLRFDFLSNMNVKNFRYQVALGHKLKINHAESDFSKNLSHPGWTFNPNVSYPSWIPLHSKDGTAKYVPFFHSYGEVIKKCFAQFTYMENDENEFE